MARTRIDSRDDIPALMRELADLQGRAIEINSRIARETQTLADTEQRMIAALAKIAQAIAAVPATAPAAPSESGLRILRTAEVARRIGLSKSSLWRMVRDGKFPRPTQLSAHAVGWLESDIEQWLNDRRASDARAEIRTRRRQY